MLLRTRVLCPSRSPRTLLPPSCSRTIFLCSPAPRPALHAYSPTRANWEWSNDLGRTGLLNVTRSGVARSGVARSGVASSRWYTVEKDKRPKGIPGIPASTTPPTPTTATTSATPELRESPYTIPNALTLARILSCPVLGYCIIHGEFEYATGILFLGGFSDWLDGYIARRFDMRSVFGTILDPAADKALMTTLVVTLAYKGLLPMPLAVLILGRDVALSLSAFYYRYISLPEPKTFKRYWDFSIPSAEVRPTQISKYNTFLQLVLMGTTTVSPLLGVDITTPLQALQWTVAGTTLWSGLSYIGSKDAVKILSKK